MKWNWQEKKPEEDMIEYEDKLHITFISFTKKYTGEHKQTT